MSAPSRNSAAVIICGILATLALQQPIHAAEATATYTYDDAGRLRNATLNSTTTSVVTYDYDAAGNRTAVVAGTSPQVPPAITVPSTSTGSYSVFWTASTGTVTAYQLYEANNASFNSETLAYSGTGTTVPLSKTTGTFYYRVRACDGALCSGFRTGSNPVALAPGAPSSITVPAGTTSGSYTVSWGAASGTLTAYQLYEATNASFTGESLAYSGTNASATLSRGNGTYYYRIRACNLTACSSFVTGANPTAVTLPPAAPASITVPSTSTGSHTVSWGASSGLVTAYQLYRATASNFSGETQVYSGTNTSAPLTTGNGTFYYRVRACNVTACSSFVAGANSIVVTVPPGPPASITVPASSLTGSYSVTWGAATGTLTAYNLYEATAANFSNEQLIYNGTNTSMARSKGNGTYYYRVRACNVAACSSFVAGANATVVTLPPSTPATISVPASSITGSYSVSWAVSSGTVTAYQLYEATNSGFSGETVVYTGTTPAASFSSKGNGTYYYRVRACNVTACSAVIAGGNPTAVTLPPAVPGATSVVSAYNNTGSYTVSWGASSSGIVTAYELLESVLFGSETPIYTGTATSFAVSGRGEATRSYRVRACNGPGCSAYTATQGNGAVVIVDTTAPTAPGSLSKLGATASMSWTGGSSDSGSGREGWNVYRNGVQISTVTVQGYTDPSPPSNTTLNYTVRTVDRAGNVSAPSNAITWYIDTVPPTTPGNLQVTTLTASQVSLSWSASSDSAGIAYYRVERSPGAGNTEFGTTFNDVTVASSTTYTFSVYAVDGNGVDSSPASVTVTTPGGVPGVPSLSGWVQNTTGDYTISWGAASGSPAYYILEEGNGGSWGPYPAINAPTTSKAFTNKPSGDYQYRVKACSSGGACSGYSGTRTVTVCDGPCL